MTNQLTDKKVAVLPFEDSEGGLRRLGVILAEGVEREFLKKGVKLVSRQDIGKLFAERDFQMSLLDSAGQTQKVGKVLKADVLVVGKTIPAGKEVLLSARAIETATGRILASTKTHSLPKSRLDELMWYVRRPSSVVPDGQLPPLSLQYAFVTQGLSGEAFLADGATVRSNQRFKIRIQPNSDCYLYVLLYDSRGDATVLFPHKDIHLDNRVRGGASYEIPDANKWYWFDQNPGAETFYVVASYTPLEEIDGILAQMKQAGGKTTQFAQAAQKEITSGVTRGMTPQTVGTYQPKGYTIQHRGVGGIVDIGWGVETPENKEMDNVVTGCATVVKKLRVWHR